MDDPLEFVARVLVDIPDKGHVTTRYYGWYANRPRGMRSKAAPAAADGLLAIASALRLAPTEASRRWASLLQQDFEIGPLVCPTCHHAMRMDAFITQPSVIDQILAHLRARPAPAAHAGARSPHRRGPPRTGGATRDAALARSPIAPYVHALTFPPPIEIPSPSAFRAASRASTSRSASPARARASCWPTSIKQDALEQGINQLIVLADAHDNDRRAQVLRDLAGT